MSDPGSGERELIAALRHGDEPSNEDRERVRGRVLAEVSLLGAGAAVATATTAKAATGSLATTAGAAANTGALATAPWKLAAVVGLVVAGAGAGVYWLAESPTPPEPVASQADAPRALLLPMAQTSPPVVEPGVVDTAAPTASAAADRVSQSPKPAASRPDPKASSTDLDGEVALLGQAQRALKEGNAARALALLDTHFTKYPRGMLRVERAGVRAIALCSAGQGTQGRAAARAFLTRYPDSPMAARIRAACPDKAE